MITEVFIAFAKLAFFSKSTNKKEFNQTIYLQTLAIIGFACIGNLEDYS